MGVVDASITVRLLLARPGDAALRARFANPEQTFHAPTHIDVEVLSAIIGMLKGAKVDPDRAYRMVQQFRDLRIVRHAVAPLGERLIALRHNFTTYDAAYVALAEGLRAPLITSDAKFARAPANCHTAQVQTYPA
jgi:predicted nucleic acid-binding protein